MVSPDMRASSTMSAAVPCVVVIETYTPLLPAGGASAPSAARDLRVGRPHHRVHEQTDERDDEHDDRPGALRRAGQVRAAERVERRANPEHEEERDSGDEQNANHVKTDPTRRRDRPTLGAWTCSPWRRSNSRRSASGSPARPQRSTAPRSALALTPSPVPAEVERRQALTAEAVALLDLAEEPPLEGIADVREPAAHAARGGVLTASVLRRLGDTAAGALRARAALEDGDAPLLRELAAAIEPELRPLVDAVGKAVEEDGSDLRDHASPKLRKLRAELRTGRHRVTERLEQLVRKSGIREHLQEDFVTQRGGRPVLAVRASSRSSVPGIVHDSSDSGQTLFVEPFEVVELSNRQSEAAGAERRRSSGSCASSAAVGVQAEAVAAAVEAAGRIDLALACGTLSRGWRGAPVEVSDDVRLVGVRHPLLVAETAVPIDLDLGALRRS